MSPINEYIVTALIIVSIVVASMTMATSLVTPLRTIFEGDRLKMVAEKLLTQILLSEGFPADWGSKAGIANNELKVFGLASQYETTREAYSLDIDKVARLDASNPLYLSPEYASKLLNLGNEYGFALEFIPALTISASPNLNGVEVTVKNHESQLVAGAKVAAKLYWVEPGGLYKSSTTLKATTDPTGMCKLKFSDISGILQSGVLIIYVDNYGTRN
ncbi:hypothetical protein KEJ19_08155, partial [Candidatus Bathyarchaeota archaeon]|nr:hypothetical protein [Candidatus Bathyarchaeota archaeon]